MSEGGRGSTAPGLVSLVGAGPGDPELLTLRGQRALARAEVVLYDRLARTVLLATPQPEGQERIHVGKKARASLAQQEAINALIVGHSLAGKQVVRLKGGDPFVLGRGGEEVEACVQAGVPVEVIPGVSSAIAAGAYAGIPLTHRAVASGFTLLTGHERWDTTEPRIDWAQAAGHGGTIVVLMGVLQCARWSQGLIVGGLDPDTPVAFVSWVSLPRQRTVVTSLGQAPDALANSGMRPPCVALVGPVVTLREELAWVEARPLQGRVIGVTRAQDDRPALQRLSELGALLVHLPLVRQRVVPGATALYEGIQRATDVVFTSPTAVRLCAEVLAPHDARAFAGRSVWALGAATAKSLTQHLGIRPDKVASEASAKGLLALASGEPELSTRRVFHPCARGARPELGQGLRALGASYESLVCYETVAHEGVEQRVDAMLGLGLDLVVLMSPSAVEVLASALPEGDTRPLKVAVIGPTTAAAARAHGFEVCVEAEPSQRTIAGLEKAIVTWAESESRMLRDRAKASET